MSTKRRLCSGECLARNISVDCCAGYQRIKCALQQYFKYNTFRPGQLEALLPIIHGNDVFVRMRTGGGKSLCMFLLPLAMSKNAIGIIVSPLVSLMDQQVKQLCEVGVSAIRVLSVDVLPNVATGKYRFVFVAPEFLELPAWKKVLSSKVFSDRLSVVAVDEAHCIAEWGKDFRTSFEKIGSLRAFTDVPIMALTASAPADIEGAIVRSLHLQNPAFVRGDIDRPNIYLSVTGIKSLSRDLDGLMKSLKSRSPESIPKTLVFTQTKNLACKVYRTLHQSAINKDYVGMYHADLTKQTKLLTQQAFSGVCAHSSMRCLVATIAFGMGIDIPDIEVVIVYGSPKTATQLYQLFGRAGRNGCLARGHLFFSKSRSGKKSPSKDCTLSSFTTGSENCRRKTLILGMGGNDDSVVSQRCCDVCTPDAITSNDRLNILELGKVVRRKKRVAARIVSDELLDNLKAELRLERTKYLQENPCFDMVGIEFVCPDVTLDELCSQAAYIETVSDISVFGIRPELRVRFFNIISFVLCKLVPRKRQRCF